MEAKIAALEEEVSILKGEIKSILQEVRTAILASENPFAGGPAVRQPAAPVEESQPAPKVVQLPSAPSEEPPPQTFAPPSPTAAVSYPAPSTSPYGDYHAEEGQDFQGMEAQHSPQARRVMMDQSPPRPASRSSHIGRTGHEDAADARSAQRLPAPDVRALAALLTWVEETRERLDDRRYRVVLGLARYGALIDEALEKTLLEAAEIVGGTEAQEHASVNDSIVALRQLEAILAQEGPSEGRVRRISDFGLKTDESDGHYPFDTLRVGREVRPSRKQ